MTIATLIFIYAGLYDSYMRLHFTVVVLIMTMLLALPIGAADDRMYTTDGMTIRQTIGSTLHVPTGISSMEVFVSFYPREDFRQSVLEQSATPTPTIRDDGVLEFSWPNPGQGQHDFNIDAIIETQNAYLPIRSKIPFPLESVPQEFVQYTQASGNIDITDEIIHMASLLASGKDDLFEVAHNIGTWVEANVEYDLSTVTAEVSKTASWTLENRAGVCGELTTLFISMMRSLGVPARFVSGIAYTNSPLFENPWGPHAWAEVYFPGYGWVPFDVTYRQFGHIDASHITLKISSDADQSYTRYVWTGNGNRVNLDPLEFNTEILSYGEPMGDYVDITMSPMFSRVGFKSANIVQMTLTNSRDHYVSTTISIASPKEVAMPDYIAVLLKPHERKTVSLLVDVEQMDPNFVYTMPIEVRSTYGSRAQTAFTVGRGSDVYSAEYLTALVEPVTSATNEALTIACDTQHAPLEHTEFILNCVVNNEGNIYYPDVEFCLNDQCTQTSLGINQQAVIEKQFTYAQGQHIVVLTAHNNDNELLRHNIPVLVHSNPVVSLEMWVPEHMKYADTYVVNMTLSLDEGAPAQDVKVTFYAGIDPMHFVIPVLDKTYILQAQIKGKELATGENEIKTILEYSDPAGKKYDQQYTAFITLAEPNAIQKVAQWLRRTLRGMFA